MVLRSQTKGKNVPCLAKNKNEVGISVQPSASQQPVFSTPNNARRSLVFNDSPESIESTIKPGSQNNSTDSKSQENSENFLIDNKDKENQTKIKMAFNATLGNLLNPDRNPIAPQFVPPRHFNPDCDDLPTFLQNYEHTAILNNWNENYKLCYLSQYLLGQAQTWLQIFALRNPTADWSATVEALKKEFSYSSFISEAKLKLRYRRQQTGENVMVYLREILKLCDLVDPKMSDDLRRDQVEQGLSPTYAYQVKLKQPQTFDELQTFLKTINDAENEVGQATKVFAQLSLTQTMPEKAETQPRKPESMDDITKIIREEIGKAMQSKQHDNLPARTATSRPVCFQCGKPGHKARVCYKNPQNQNRNYGQRRSFQGTRSSNLQQNSPEQSFNTQQQSGNASGRY